MALAGVTLLLVLVRTALVFVENQHVLAHSRREALTDPLTGLRNRRSLMADLEESLPSATREESLALVLFDLDGFKEYNDAFGHPAGDRLLVRLGERLDDAVHGHGSAYRLGGDEFCVVLHPGPAGVDVLVDACLGALREHGEGFDVTTSHGVVEAPMEVSNATDALQMADRRMYARKGDRRVSAGRQSRDVLLRSLSERQPALHVHLRGTADLAMAVGRELEMHGEELDDVAHAAELHDVGKIAIPDAILEKAGSLDENEWALHAPAHDHRRADPDGGAVAAQRGQAGALEPRALGRRRLPGRAGRRGDPAGRPRGRGLRRLRRHDHEPPLPPPRERAGGDSGAAGLRGHAVRPRGREGLRAGAGARDDRGERDAADR